MKIGKRETRLSAKKEAIQQTVNSLSARDDDHKQRVNFTNPFQIVFDPHSTGKGLCSIIFDQH
jgi:hypothetical protein